MIKINANETVCDSIKSSLSELINWKTRAAKIDISKTDIEFI